MARLNTEIWNNWYYHDVFIALLVGVLVWISVVLSRREYWRLAFRQVFERRVMRVCFTILSVYTLIALLDSVGCHPSLRNADGTLLRDPQTGTVVCDPDGISVLDLLLTPIRADREKTYSAPLAARQFTKETMTNEKGEIVRDYPPLKYPRRHLLGTDRVGNDVLYLSLKSICTGMIIGAFTTMLVVPFAIAFGVVAGYFGKRVDDIIQYIYTVLDSIPSVLLIAAFMIIVNTKFPDVSRLAALCIIMGITSWTGLCRVLRGETFKLREMEYVQAAEAMGISRARIICRHIVPNLMHIVLITSVLGFSGRVLAEAILTYIGIGVGPETISWGTMINDALRELARSPVIWWKLLAAFIFTIGLLIPANMFGDALRDALDPRLRTE